MKTVKLNYHLLQDKQLISFTSGIRPYRSEGIRLEKQTIEGKTIYHDYGHGGGGLSLGWGCAKYIVDKLFLPSQPDKTQPVAILGAGIIGISTAWYLVQKGFRVNMYADNFAYDTRPERSQITTTVAAGLWMPVKISAKNSLKDLSLDTLDHFYQIVQLQKKTGANLGITEMPCYIVNDKEAELYSTIKGIIPYQHIKVTFDGSQTLDAIVFNTIVIETSFYLPHIMEKLNKSGLFKIIEKQIVSQKEVLELKQQHIFNCLGFFGNKFFSDPSPMKPVKGHVARVTPSPQIMDFILFLKTPTRFILQVPHKQKNILNIGINFEEGNHNPYPDRKEIDLTLKTYKQFFGEVKNKQMQRPKL